MQSAWTLFLRTVDNFRRALYNKDENSKDVKQFS